MVTVTSLREDLTTLERHLENLTAIPETPQSLLQILKYSLSTQGQGEVFMTRVLRYFLDPSEPHGMNDEFLRAFLDGLRAHQRAHPADTTPGPFDEDTFDLSGVVVDRQVRMGESTDDPEDSIDRTGPVDLVVESPGEWFLIIELKFGATENNLHGDGLSQTERYRAATHIEDRPKHEYESGGYYLYLHKTGTRPAEDDQFTNWTWEALVEDVLTDFIATNTARYPNRTGVQLRELRDDIQELTGMTENERNIQAKTELFFEHYDAIKTVTDAFEERWAAFAEEWASRFAASLAESGYGDALELDDRIAGFDLARDESSERWVFRARNSDWAHLMKDGWWRHTDDLSVLHTRPDDRNDARIGFYHRLEANQHQAIGDHTLELTFRNMGANDDEYIAAFNDAVCDRKTEIRQALPEPAKLESITDTRRDLITATYDIQPEAYEDYFTAYLAALQLAFEDLVVSNPEFVALIDEAQADALELYR